VQLFDHLIDSPESPPLLKTIVGPYLAQMDESANLAGVSFEEGCVDCLESEMLALQLRLHLLDRLPSLEETVGFEVEETELEIDEGLIVPFEQLGFFKVAEGWFVVLSGDVNVGQFDVRHGIEFVVLDAFLESGDGLLFQFFLK
jgi:hypothetical protein